jgi:hypothetical protein
MSVAQTARREEETDELKLERVEDEHALKRMFDVLSMWPRVTDEELKDRVREFVLNAEPDEFLQMHQAASEILGDYFFGDEDIQPVIEAFSGRQVGFAIRKFYKATLTVESGRFRVDSGIEQGVPVMWCASRQDYVEVMLGDRDPVKMVLTRRMGATRMGTLMKWWLPYIDVLINDEVVSKYSSFQPKITRRMRKQLSAMGY